MTFMNGHVHLVGIATLLLSVTFTDHAKAGQEFGEHLDLLESLIDLSDDTNGTYVAIDRALDLLSAARQSFRATTADDVAAARLATERAAACLGKKLDSAGRFGQDWKRYLLWEQLTEQLDNRSVLSSEKLSEVLTRLEQGHESLELPAFAQLRDALRWYASSLSDLNGEHARQEYAEHLDLLQRLIESFGESADSETLQRITPHLKWLQRHRQAPRLVSAVHALAPAANVRVAITRRMISQATREELDRSEPLTDQILGTTIHGTTHLTGTMAAFPVADDTEVHLQARLQGDADSVGRGFNGPVRAKIVGHAEVQAATDIYFGPEGFRVGATGAGVDGTGKPTCLWSTCRSRIAESIVVKVARRRAAKTQQESDCIASRHAEERLVRQLGPEVASRLASVQQEYQASFRGPLLRRESFPRVFECFSCEENAQLEMLLASPAQTGALAAATTWKHQGDIQLQIHETAVNNLSTTFLAGKTYSETELRALFDRLRTSTSKPVEVAEDDQVQIVFDDARLLSVRLHNSQVVVTIRAQYFIRGRTRYRAMNMILRYGLSDESGQPRLQQTEPPEVVPRDFEERGPRRLAARESAARRFITGMLERQLPSEIPLSDLRMAPSDETLGELVVTQLSTYQGWLELAANQASARGSELNR